MTNTALGWAQSRTHLRLVWLKFLCAIVRREPEIYSLLHDENVGSEPNWSCLVTGEADWAAQTLRLLGVIGAACKDESLYSRKSALVEAVLQRLEALPIREEAVHLVGYLADAFLDEGLVEHWVEPNFSLVLDAAFATLASHSASSTVALRWLDALRATIAFPKMLEVGCGTSCTMIRESFLGAIASDFARIRGGRAGAVRTCSRILCWAASIGAQTVYPSSPYGFR